MVIASMNILQKFLSKIWFRFLVHDRTLSRFGDRILWEVPVQLALKDFLPAGGCALDVGANIGALSIAMSRLVGSHGQVHAFEANPKLYGRITRSFCNNQVTNITLVPLAVWRTTGEQLSFSCDPSYLASSSSLSKKIEGGTDVTVETITLDDYCRQHCLVPDMVKIDVEGAEMEVLRGARQLMHEHSPIFVLEYCVADYQDEDPLDFLTEQGYMLIDTNLYQQVNRRYFLTNFAHAPVENIVAVPASHPAASAYIAALDARTLICDTPCCAPYAQSPPIMLPAYGRYLVKVELTGPPSQSATVLVKEVAGETLITYTAPISHLQQPCCSCLVFDIDRPTSIVCELASMQPEVPVELRHVSVQHLHELPLHLNTLTPGSILA